jgi:hypothetical protein
LRKIFSYPLYILGDKNLTELTKISKLVNSSVFNPKSVNVQIIHSLKHNQVTSFIRMFKNSTTGHFPVVLEWPLGALLLYVEYVLFLEYVLDKQLLSSRKVKCIFFNLFVIISYIKYIDVILYI